MCDLIDLDNSANSPVNTKLASPLIPVPQNIEHGNLNVFNDQNTLIIEKRESLDNNPFDMVLHEAIEYVRKKEDPFEIVFEKALQKDETVILDNNITDDLKATYTHFSQKLKEEKTLDESFSNTDFVKPIIEIKSPNSSILNQSAMNDTLYETNCDTEEKDIKCIFQQETQLDIQTVGNDIETIPTHKKPIPSKYIRSHSQGDIIQECKQCFRHRSNSAIETLKTGKVSTSDMDGLSSLGYSDTLNRGFLQDQYSDNSVFSTLSNVSNITRLNSTSLTYNSVSSMTSNNTMNRAFLNSWSSDIPCNVKLNGRMNNTMNTVSVSSETSLPITPVQTQIDMSILAQKLNDVKTRLSKSQITQAENTKSDYLSGRILNNTDPYLKNTSIKATIDMNDKLLDVNSGSSEIASSKSCSDGSSDSIFLESSKANKSILIEATALAKTFEEFAQESSGSISDEFIINDPMWTSKLLPAFEDEIVDDLIEVLSSPNVKKNAVHISEEESTNEISCKSNAQNNSNNVKSKNDMKKIEASTLSPIAVNKKVASTLLLDLKKIVKSENNAEANRLLENLEKVLGIGSDNSIELISTYLQAANDPRKSNETRSTKSEIIQNIGDEKYVNKNNVNDLEIHQITNNEDLCHHDKMKNKMRNEVLNDSKNLMITESKIQNNVTLASKLSAASSNKKARSIRAEEEEEEDNDVSVCHSTCPHINKNEKTNNETEDNEKVAVDLLINLGKVLSGLKNLGEVLQLVSKYKQENCNEEHDVSHTSIKSTVINNNSRTGKRVSSLMSSKSVTRQSLDSISKTKPSNEKVFRRSMSVTSTPPNTNVQSVLVSKEKSQLNENSKRFPSDPGLINLASYKRGVSVSTGDVRKEVINIQRVNGETNNQKEKPATKIAVKNQLKCKIKSEVVNRKGPMKAIIPLGNMQRKGIVTPPKSPKNVQPSIKIRSSTPNSMENGVALKKSKSKPKASSTPSTPKRTSTVQLPSLQRCDKLNVSCDISPITVQEEVTSTDKYRIYLSPNSTSKCPSPRRTTPKKKLQESSIPKYSTSPGVRVRHSSYDMNKSGQITESLQVSYKRDENVYKKSPGICKRIGVSPQKSPLKDSNKNINKGKPLNLTSKLRRNENGIIGSGKENTVS